MSLQDHSLLPLVDRLPARPLAGSLVGRGMAHAHLCVLAQARLLCAVGDRVYPLAGVVAQPDAVTAGVGPARECGKKEYRTLRFGE